MDKTLYYMQKAIEQAEIAAAENEVPVGAVIVRNDEIVATGRNRREQGKCRSISSPNQSAVLCRRSVLNFSPTFLKTYAIKNHRKNPAYKSGIFYLLLL